MYGLFARLYGNNNLPDSSNMCHESTSVALPESIGVPVGTVHAGRLRADRLHLLLRPERRHQQPAHAARACRMRRKRGVPIVTFNPLRERGLVEFTNPQSPSEMLTGAADPRSARSTTRSRPAATSPPCMGICKALIEARRRRPATAARAVLDAAFIAEHTHGFEEFAERGAALRLVAI